MHVDLLIVGGSFAGLACAREAVRHGLSVVVLEKKECPGDKLHTTGIFVKEAIEECRWFRDAPKELFRQIDKVRLYAPDMRKLDLYAPGYYFVATETPGLLNWMADSIRSDGVDVMCGTLFETVSQTVDGLWKVPVTIGRSKGAGEEKIEIMARYLIGADGPKSKVARVLGLSENTEFLYGMEKEYQHADLDEDYLHCFLDKRLASGYIGWGLASQGYFQVGLARRLSSGVKEGLAGELIEFDAFLEKIAPVIQVNSSPINVRAGFIPCGGTLKSVACPSAMLIGDAAGTVSPVTAGGIHSALRYAQQAGEAVAHYLRGRENDPAQWFVKKYPRYLTKRLLRWGYDHCQSDWIFNQVLSSAPFRRFAEQIYFHRKGG